MNSQIRFLGVGLLACFVVLFVQLNRVQLVQQDELQANPANNRQIERDFSRPRGSIFTADGVVIATSVEVDDDLERERTYPERELYAHTTGFFSFQFGADGLERDGIPTAQGGRRWHRATVRDVIRSSAVRTVRGSRATVATTRSPPSEPATPSTRLHRQAPSA